VHDDSNIIPKHFDSAAEPLELENFGKKESSQRYNGLTVSPHLSGQSISLKARNSSTGINLVNGRIETYLVSAQIRSSSMGGFLPPILEQVPKGCVC
jgi:hypothetical protein